MKTEAELDKLVEESCKERQACQIYDELRRLVSLLNRLNIKTVLEIGTEEGGSLKLWTKLFPVVELVCVDANTYPHTAGKQVELAREWRSWLSINQSLQIIWGDSHSEKAEREISNQVIKWYPQGFDMAFIDGDHSEEGVEKDFLLCKKFVKPGGVIVVADIHPIEREDMKCWRWWQRFIGIPISQEKDRGYHPGARPNYIEIFHDQKYQRAFGFGVVFL